MAMILYGNYLCIDTRGLYGLLWFCMDSSYEFILTLDLLKVGLVKP